jgi:hypothetical protein
MFKTLVHNPTPLSIRVKGEKKAGPLKPGQLSSDQASPGSEAQ